MLDPSAASFHLSKLGGRPKEQQGPHEVSNVEAGRMIRPLCTMPTFQSFRIEGRVTTSCLWHACRAVTIGTILIGTGITMAILGKFLQNKGVDIKTMKNILLISIGNIYIQMVDCADEKQWVHNKVQIP